MSDNSIFTHTQRRVGILQAHPATTLHVGGGLTVDSTPISVPAGSIQGDALANGAVTSAKMSPLVWTTVTYENGFGAVSGWGPVQYTRTAEGLVLLRGLLNCPTGWAHGVSAFTLPVGYRLVNEPGSPGYHHYGCYSNGPNGNGQAGITVHTSGVISPWMGPNGTSGTAGQWFDLNNLRFTTF